MARDPQLPLTDVQWVLGHAHLSTTQLYLTPLPGDVITEVLAHHHRRSGQLCASPVGGPPRPAAAGYRRESLEALFGGRPW
jgi:hypothetical protein